MATIGIDANEVLHGERAIRRYTLQLIQALIKISSPHLFRLVYFHFRKPHHEIPRQVFASSHATVEERRIFLPGQLMAWSWDRLGFPGMDLLAGNTQLFHATGKLIPPRGKFPILVTLHSMAHRRIPEHLPAWYVSVYEKLMKRAVQNADYFITVSESMKRDFIRFYGVPESRIQAIPLGVGEEFRPREKQGALQEVNKRWGINRPYLLYVGGLQKNKNIEGILKAFALVREKVSKDLMLVLAGSQPMGTEDVLQGIDPWNLRPHVALTGYLHQETDELPLLYAGAEVFLFPSFWEGWASPPLEAMACGIPVVASDILPLRENLKDAAIFVSPCDPEAMAEAIEKFLTQPELVQDYRERGLARAKSCTWASAAKQTLDYYEEIIRGAS